MSIPSTNQVFEVQGELRVITPVSTTAAVQGRVTFTDSDRKTLGVLKVFGGTLSNYRLILDTASITNGLSIRSASSSGLPDEGGAGFPYLANFKSQNIEFNSPTTIGPTFTLKGDSSERLLTLRKALNSSTLASAINDKIMQIILETLQVGQAVIVEIGSSFSNERGQWGYRGGYTPSTQNYMFLGFATSSSAVSLENLKLTRDGNVKIPLRLDVGTIYATSYLNLPPPDLLPITLSGTHVGINQTSPTEALDVVGNIKSTGTVTADTIQATNWIGLPPTDLLPITLDKVGGNVGINNTNPQTDLDVGGEIQCQALQTNDIVINTTVPGEGLYVAGEVEFPTLAKVSHPSVLSYDHTTGKVDYMDLNPITLDNNKVGIRQPSPQTDLDVNGTTSTKFLMLQSIPNVTQPDVLMYDPLTKAVSYGPAPSPTPDLLPITLDKINSRVGINSTTPQHALDVVGAINIPTANSYLIGGSNGVSFKGSDLSTVAVGKVDVIPSTSLNAVAIGLNANAGLACVSVGQFAGRTSQGTNTVAIGNNAASNTQGNSSISIGWNAGTTSQGVDSVAVGVLAGNNLQEGSCVAIGSNCGRTAQKLGAVAIGANSGNTNQSSQAVAVGRNAGIYNQGQNAIAIGVSAGAGTSTAGTGQGNNSIAIGNVAGQYTQGIDCVAIGYDTARGTTTTGTGQGAGAIAIGRGAGNSTQGINSVAIGKFAGMTGQHNYSIILNGTGSQLNSTFQSAFYVKPIRAVVDATMPRLSYNATTGEIMYGNSTTDSLLPMTLDKTNNRVGINKTVPTTALDVAGAVTASGVIVSGSTTTSTLSLTGITNTAKPNVLMYDKTTKEVSYGPAGGSSPVFTSTSIIDQPFTPTPTNYCNQNVTPGLYMAMVTYSHTGYDTVVVEFNVLATGNPGYIARKQYYSNQTGYVRSDTFSMVFQIINSGVLTVECTRYVGSQTISMTLNTIKLS